MPIVKLLSQFRTIGAADNNLDNAALNPTPGSAEISAGPRQLCARHH